MTESIIIDIGIDIREISDIEMERLRKGYKPNTIEQKWIINFEDGWLSFLRLWNNLLVYKTQVIQDMEGKYNIKNVKSYIRQSTFEEEKQFFLIVLDILILQRENSELSKLSFNNKWALLGIN